MTCPRSCRAPGAVSRSPSTCPCALRSPRPGRRARLRSRRRPSSRSTTWNISSARPSEAAMADQLKVMGLDTGLTSAGAAEITGGPLGGYPRTYLIRSARTSWARLDSQVNRIGLAVKTFDPDLIVVEGPALHATGSYFHENAGLWWAVTHRIWKSGRPMAVIPPAVLKKWATGKGN